MPPQYVPVTETTSIADIGGGEVQAKVASGPVFFKDDQAAWMPVVAGSDASLPGNCELVPIANGYRMWKPNGKPPYNPAWQPTDYWLQVEDTKGVTAFKTQRSQVTEVIVLQDAGSTQPATVWTWNDNLTHKVIKGIHTWIDSLTNEVIFTKGVLTAHSQSDVNMKDLRVGTEDVDDQGNVTITIDLSGLSYPVELA